MRGIILQEIGICESDNGLNVRKGINNENDIRIDVFFIKEPV